MVILFTAQLSIHICHESSFLGTRWAGTVTSQLLKKGKILRLTRLTYPTSPLLILQNISLSLSFGLLVKGCLHFLFHFTKHTNTHFFLTFSLTTPLVHTLHHNLHHLFPTRSLENSFGTTKHLHIFYLR